MGRVIYLDRLKEHLKATPVFRAKDVEIFIKNKRYAHLLLHNLARRGEINRVVKGWYSWYDDPVFSVFCFRPAYIGLQEALSFHGLWEQETNVVIVTVLKVRTGLRKIFDNNIVLHRISKRYFFGLDYLRYGNFFIPVSDIEKTLIDLIYFKEPIPREVIKVVRKKIDRERLLEYLKEFPPRFRERTLRILFKQ